jgi:hypothetical protein
MLLKIWSEHNELLKPMIGKDCSYSLWQKHNTTLNYFKAFLKSKLRMDDMAFPTKPQGQKSLSCQV